MGTRSITEIRDHKGNSIRYYHHYDSYPSYLGKILMGNLLTVEMYFRDHNYPKFQKFQELLDEDDDFHYVENGNNENEEYMYFITLGNDEVSIYYDQYDYGKNGEYLKKEKVKLF